MGDILALPVQSLILVVSCKIFLKLPIPLSRRATTNFSICSKLIFLPQTHKHKWAGGPWFLPRSIAFSPFLNGPERNVMFFSCPVCIIPGNAHCMRWVCVGYQSDIPAGDEAPIGLCKCRTCKKFTEPTKSMDLLLPCFLLIRPLIERAEDVHGRLPAMKLLLPLQFVLKVGADLWTGWCCLIKSVFALSFCKLTNAIILLN